jgi:hypothetical protein
VQRSKAYPALGLTLRMLYRFVLCAAAALAISNVCVAQVLSDPATSPLATLEAELQPIAQEVLQGNDYARKLGQNQLLFTQLGKVLQRPDSYHYGFDSLVTISRQFPADQSFRVFTWQLVQQDTANSIREHVYYGYVQRMWVDSTGDSLIVVIPLIDSADYHARIETEELPNRRWLGALYYKPEYAPFGVLTYDGQYAKFNNRTQKLQKFPIRYYMKMLDVISFDPRDSSRVSFGAPIFTLTGAVQKYRMVFKYSDNSPFSLNQRLVVTGGLIKKKRLMLVFEHLEMPRAARPLELYALGTDGTQDAMYWTDRVNDQRKGFFVLLRKVTVFDPRIEGYSPKVLKKQAKLERKRLRSMGIAA